MAWSEGESNLNLDPDRMHDPGEVLHELLHVLGMQHEHQRPDRDDFVHVCEDKLRDGK